MKEKVIILGAGTFQKGLIVHLKKLGFYTIAVTNRPEELSTEIADELRTFSYTNISKVIELYKEAKAVQVFSVASEGPLLTQSQVQEDFGLKGNSKNQVEFFLNKWNYKKKLLNTKLSPETKHLNETDFSLSFENKESLIVKPVQGSGSKNVKKIEAAQQLETIDSSKDYIIEKYIEGKEMGCDLFIHHGKIIYSCPTHKRSNEWHVPNAHLILSDTKHEIISPFIDQLKNKLQLNDGFYNLDIMLQNNQPFLLDISPRLGGNCIPELCNLAYGINEYSFLTSWLLNRPFPNTSSKFIQNAGVYIIGSTEPGILKTIEGENHPFTEHEIELYWNKRIGEKVEVFSEGKNHLGYFIYKANGDEELQEIHQKINLHQWFTLEKKEG